MRVGISLTSKHPDVTDPRRISRAAVAGVVVIAAGKFHEQARLVPDRPTHHDLAAAA
jgi:hypothetical protein